CCIVKYPFLPARDAMLVDQQTVDLRRIRPDTIEARFYLNVQKREREHRQADGQTRGRDKRIEFVAPDVFYNAIQKVSVHKPSLIQWSFTCGCKALSRYATCRPVCSRRADCHTSYHSRTALLISSFGIRPAVGVFLHVSSIASPAVMPQLLMAWVAR